MWCEVASLTDAEFYELRSLLGCDIGTRIKWTDISFAGKAVRIDNLYAEEVSAIKELYPKCCYTGFQRI